MKRIQIGFAPYRYIIALCVLNVVLVLAYGFNHMAHHEILLINGATDLDGEESFAAWYSSLQLGLIGLLFGVSCLYTTRRLTRRAFLGLAGFACMFLFLSADEAMLIHERIGRMSDALLPGGSRSNTVLQRTGIWMVLLGPPLLLAFVLVMWLARGAMRPVPWCTTRMVIGFGLLLGGAACVEVFSNFWPVGWRNYIIQVGIEEGMEMMGGTVMLWAALDVAAYYVVAERVSQPVPARETKHPRLTAEAA